jgi:hypothetical protein
MIPTTLDQPKMAVFCANLNANQPPRTVDFGAYQTAYRWFPKGPKPWKPTWKLTGVFRGYQSGYQRFRCCSICNNQKSPGALCELICEEIVQKFCSRKRIDSSLARVCGLNRVH